MPKIESPQNTTFKKCLSLTSAKGLKQEGAFLLSGEKLVREFLANPHLKILLELGTARMTPLPRGSLQHADADYLELSSELFAQIDVLGTHFNILVLEQPPITSLTREQLASYEPRGLEAVMPIGDPGNLGALIRSCEAFAVPRILLTQEAAHPFLPKAVKASAGSVLRVPLARGPALAEFPDSCIALDKDGTPIDHFTWPENGMLVVGEEGAGLGGKNFTQRIRIPTQGVESLNAVVAASIALAHRAASL
ncbi:MAG: RNA methyltransferase [Alphaproteobacteria bacterium]|nr:RNA methyltransferase [Alphaproteobacteria bacterium]